MTDEILLPEPWADGLNKLRCENQRRPWIMHDVLALLETWNADLHRLREAERRVAELEAELAKAKE